MEAISFTWFWKMILFPEPSPSTGRFDHWVRNCSCHNNFGGGVGKGKLTELRSWTRENEQTQAPWSWANRSLNYNHKVPPSPPEKFHTAIGAVTQSFSPGSGECEMILVMSIWETSSADPGVIKWRSETRQQGLSPLEETRFVKSTAPELGISTELSMRGVEDGI